MTINLITPAQAPELNPTQRLLLSGIASGYSLIKSAEHVAGVTLRTATRCAAQLVKSGYLVRLTVGYAPTNKHLPPSECPTPDNEPNTSVVRKVPEISGPSTPEIPEYSPSDHPTICPVDTPPYYPPPIPTTYDTDKTNNIPNGKGKRGQKSKRKKRHSHNQAPQSASPKRQRHNDRLPEGYEAAYNAALRLYQQFGQVCGQIGNVFSIRFYNMAKAAHDKAKVLNPNLASLEHLTQINIPHLRKQDPKLPLVGYIWKQIAEALYAEYNLNPKRQFA